MSVIYMLKLEQQPELYEQKFTKLTKGANKDIQDWIVQRISPNDKVLDIGCGPGILLKKIAEKGAIAFGIDKNPEMVVAALKTRQDNPNLQVFVDEKDALSIPQIENGYDSITSTFMLSELRYFERLGFLYHCWDNLTPGGSLFIAEEFIPNSFAKIPFYMKKWWYTIKIKGIKRRLTEPLTNLEEMANQIGYKTIDRKYWQSGAIRVFQFQKPIEKPASLYFPKMKPWKGLRRMLEWIRCVFTGQIDHPKVEPGIYKVGTPEAGSPIIATCNYLLTYNRLMKDLEGLNVWVLCIDSQGINVWCAARGNNFGNEQLIEAIKYSKISTLPSNKIIILPQLSAGGVSVPKIIKDIGFSFKYGPVWSKDIKTFIQTQNLKKNENQSIAKFSVEKRIEAGLSHTAFLIRRFILLPSLVLLLISIFLKSLLLVHTVQLVWILIIFMNMLFALIYPMFNKITVFYRKGLLYATFFTALFMICLLFSKVQLDIFLIIGFASLVFWLSLASVLSFSGYTMETSAREIQAEYPIFLKIQKSILYISIIFIALGLSFYIF